MNATKMTGYQVRTPNTVEDTGLDSAVFATRAEAEHALAVLASSRDLAPATLELCGVVSVVGAPTTTFRAWNESGW